MRERTLRSARPVDLWHTLYPLRRGRVDPCLRLSGRHALRATRTPAGPATVQLESNGREIAARAWGAGAEWALEQAGQLLGCDDDPGDFGPAHPVVRELDRALPGLRMGRSLGVVEFLVPTILEQKVTGKEARRSYAALVRRFGEPAPGPFDLYVPPDAATWRELPYWTWHRAGVEERRARAVRVVCSYARRLEEAAALTPDELHEKLVALPGIGDWTAAHTTMAVQGNTDALLVGDFHIPHLVTWTLAGEERGSDARMLELLAPFRGHRARVVRLIEAGGARPARRSHRMPLRSIARI